MLELLSSLPRYPEGARLSETDNRFWVARGNTEELIVFVDGSDKVLSDSGSNIFTGLDLVLDVRYQGTRILCILDDPSIESKFVTVVKYISIEATSYTGPQLFNFLLREFNDWSAFLRPKQDGISESELTGLWGELHVMSQFYCKKYSPSKACAYFLGPSGAPQDFGGVGFTLEVKTTKDKAPSELKISSLNQLFAKSSEQAITLLQIDESDEGESLTNYLDLIEGYLKSDLSVLMSFQKKVHGLVGRASEEQLKRKHVVQNITCWSVCDSFPKLTPENVPKGVQKAQYSLRISDLSGFQINYDLEGFLHGK
jgi:hypothetical protein